MKKNYINPEVQVTELASMPLMQAGSPGSTMGLFGETGDQW